MQECVIGVIEGTGLNKKENVKMKRCLSLILVFMLLLNSLLVNAINVYAADPATVYTYSSNGTTFTPGNGTTAPADADVMGTYLNSVSDLVYGRAPDANTTTIAATAVGSSWNSNTAPGGRPELPFKGNRKYSGWATSNSWSTNSADISPSSTHDLGIAASLVGGTQNITTVIINAQTFLSANYDQIAIYTSTDDNDWSTIAAGHTNTTAKWPGPLVTGDTGSLSWGNWTLFGNYTTPASSTDNIYEFKSSTPVNAKYVMLVIHKTSSNTSSKPYVSSFEVYNDNPTISPTSGTYVGGQASPSTTMALKGFSLSSIVDDTSHTLASVTDYNVAGNDFTFTSSYLDALPIGAHTLTFSFSDGSTQTYTLMVQAAPTPLSISTQPATSTTVTQGSISGSLSVTAAGGINPYSYQWYSCSDAGGTNPQSVSGATYQSFTIPTDLTPGTYYYYAVVKDNATPTASATTSSVAAVTVQAPLPLSISTQPASPTVTAGSISGSLSVTAKDGLAPYKYQWYSCRDASGTDPQSVSGATYQSFAIPTNLTMDTYYYYAVISDSTLPIPIEVMSNVATVTVSSAPTNYLPMVLYDGTRTSDGSSASGLTQNVKYSSQNSAGNAIYAGGSGWLLNGSSCYKLSGTLTQWLAVDLGAERQIGGVSFYTLLNTVRTNTAASQCQVFYSSAARPELWDKLATTSPGTGITNYDPAADGWLSAINMPTGDPAYFADAKVNGGNSTYSSTFTTFDKIPARYILICYTLNNNASGMIGFGGLQIIPALPLINPTAGTYTRTLQNSVSTEITPFECSLASITENSTSLVGGIDYTVDNNNNVTFSTSYLNNLALGRHALNFTFSDGTIRQFILSTQTALKSTISPPSGTYIQSLKNAVNITLTLNSNTLTSITEGVNTLDTTNYTIDTNNNLIFIPSYLKDLSVGAHTLTLNFSAGVPSTYKLNVVATPVESNIDYSIWTLQEPTYPVGKSSYDLQAGLYDAYWYHDTVTGYDAFMDTATGATSSGSAHCRTEMRELLPDSTTYAGWSALGYNVMEETVKVTQLGTTNGSGSTVVGQIFNGNANSKPLFEMMYKSDGYFRFIYEGDGNPHTTEVSNYQVPLGTPFKVRYELINDVLKVYLATDITNNPTLFNLIFDSSDANYNDTIAPPEGDPYYFKAGNYDQTAISGQINKNPYTIVEIPSLNVQHNPVSGTLNYSDGTPKANQTVIYTLSGGGLSNTITRTVTTDSNGNYTINNVPYNGGSIANVLILDTEAPIAPTNLALVDKTTSTGNLSWNASTSNDVVSYVVYKDGAAVNDINITVAGSVYSILVENLTPNTTYNFTVKAVDAAGNYSAASNELAVTTNTAELPVIPDTEAPIAPTNLALVDKTTSTVNLSWNASTSNDVAGYVVYKDGTAINDANITVAGSVYSIEVGNLTQNTAYKFTVKALDTAGNYSTASNELAVTTNRVHSSGGSNVSEGKPNEQVGTATGISRTTVTSDELNKLISQATADNNGNKTVSLVIPKVEGANTYSQQLPIAALTTAGEKQVIKIETDLATVAVPGNMLGNADVGSAKDVVINISSADKGKLSADVKEKVGHRPIIELRVTINGKQVEYNNPNAPVQVTVPYTPSAEEAKHPEHIVVWYVDGAGKIVAVPSGKYDPETGKVTFTTTHFSQYAIAYVEKSFSDIANVEWAKDSIEVMASKGVISGTSENTFTPNENVKRGDFMLLLVKALGLTSKVDSNFNDVSKSDYYYDAIGIAKELGIAKGQGDSKFNPEESISRQDMMVIISRAMKLINKISSTSGANLDNFIDKNKVASYAAEDVALLVKDGLVKGSNNEINPLDNTTRAEAAVLIYRMYNK